MSAKKKQSNENKEQSSPLFTFRLILILVLLGGLSAAASMIWKSNQIAKRKVDQHKNNPNVIKLPPVAKRDYKAPIPTSTQKYREKTIFPYLKKNQKPVRKCYFGYKWKKKPNRGILGLTFEVGPSGTPLNIKFYKDQIKNKTITDCVLKEAKKWKFPPHKFPKNLPVSFPFAFF